MARWGRADFEGFRDLQQRIAKLSGAADMDGFCRACCRALAARLLALVIPKTPVGHYPKASGKKGGTLRRGWGADTAAKAGGYAGSLPIVKTGDGYQIEIINPVEYASYVEFGHRTRDGAGWVEGRYMLTVSEETLKKAAPGILEKMLLEHLKEAFHV